MSQARSWTMRACARSGVLTPSFDAYLFEVKLDPVGDIDETGMTYEIAIYRVAMPDNWETTPAVLETEDNWGTPERVIYSDLAVREPSITADGEFLYFEQIFSDGNGNFNPEMMRVRRN